MKARDRKLKTVLAALEADESLLDCFLDMVDTVNDEQGTLKTGDDAEDAVTEVVQKTAQTLLTKWVNAKGKEMEAKAAQDRTLRPHEKKRFGGIPLMET